VTKALLTLAFLILLNSSLAAQTSFNLDEPFKHTANIPKALLPLLATEIKSTCKNDAAFQASDVRSLFVASRITLNHRPAFILKSGHHCLTGGDNDFFWVYVSTRRRYRLVLTGGTISLGVRRTRTHGLRDIATSVCTGAYCFAKTYKFDGSTYSARICEEAELRDRPPKYHRVPCRQ
jgi:hypothetical protein